MMRRKVLVFLFLVSAPVVAAESPAVTWNEEEQTVIRFLEDLPRALSREQLDLYMSYYREDFSGWYLSTERFMDFQQLEQSIERFLAEGHRMLDSRVTPLQVQVEGKRAFARYVEEEKVRDPDGSESWKKYHFVVTLLRNDAGAWQFKTINFIEVARNGAMQTNGWKSPALSRTAFDESPATVGSGSEGSGFELRQEV